MARLTVEEARERRAEIDQHMRNRSYNYADEQRFDLLIDVVETIANDDEGEGVALAKAAEGIAEGGEVLDLDTVTYSLTEYEASVLQRALGDLVAERDGEAETASVLLERANDQLRPAWRWRAGEGA